MYGYHTSDLLFSIVAHSSLFSSSPLTISLIRLLLIQTQCVSFCIAFHSVPIFRNSFISLCSTSRYGEKCHLRELHWLTTSVRDSNSCIKCAAHELSQLFLIGAHLCLNLPKYHDVHPQNLLIIQTSACVNNMLDISSSMQLQKQLIGSQRLFP